MTRSILGAASTAAATLTLLVSGSVVATEAATAAEQRVRIEGRASTLFEGPVSAVPHAVKASSDRTPRRCDGTNNGAGTTAVPTPTSVADDGMRIIGSDFDARRTPGFDDYYLTRFGPDAPEIEGASDWGVIVNGIATSVGGCQVRLNPGDQTLWVYDAFRSRPLLRLDGPSGVGEPTAATEGAAPTGATQQSFAVGLGQPFSVSVVRNAIPGSVGSAGARGPAAGVSVAPVTTGANGFQTVVRTDPSAVVTGADGRATLAWSTPGWKRIKADGDGFVRSNRLDVCVLNASGGDCGALPADAQIRTPPASTLPPVKETPTGSGSIVDGGGTSGSAITISLGDSAVRGLRVTTDGHPSGLVGVRWTVDGSPLRTWTIESRRKGVKRARWTKAASGTTETAALLDLSTGRASELRITMTASTGAQVTRGLGTVVVPLDDRLRSVRFGGGWARDRDPLAWRQTTTRMRRGATLSTKLAAGRPTLVVRSDRKTARIELRVGKGKAQRLTVRAHRDGRTALISGRKGKAGTVRVKVLSGTVHVDGVAVRP